MQSSSTVPLLVHEARSRRNSAVVYGWAFYRVYGLLGNPSHGHSLGSGPQICADGGRRPAGCDSSRDPPHAGPRHRGARGGRRGASPGAPHRPRHRVRPRHGTVGRRWWSAPWGGVALAVGRPWLGLLLDDLRRLRQPRDRRPRHAGRHRVPALVRVAALRGVVDPGRRLARGQFLESGHPHRRRQCGRAGGAPARPRGALGRDPLRRRHRADPSRHRQGDGAGRVRHHVRRSRLRAGAGLRARRPVDRAPIARATAAPRGPARAERLTHL